MDTNIENIVNQTNDKIRRYLKSENGSDKEIQCFVDSVTDKITKLNTFAKDNQTLTSILFYLAQANEKYIISVFSLDTELFIKKTLKKYHQLSKYKYAGKTSYDYTRFILLTSQRCGSNYLATSLNSHSEINMFSEIFNKNNIFFGNYEFKKLPAGNNKLKKLRNNYPKEFLKTIIFKEYPDFIKTCGFKLFYENIRNPQFKATLEDILNKKDVKIIHLKRKDLVAKYYSYKKAKLSGLWTLNNSTRKNINPMGELKKVITGDKISITENELIRYLDNYQKSKKFAEELVRKKQVLEIYYENITEDYIQTTKNIQKFLNIEFEELISTSVKQNTTSPDKILNNYQTLKKTAEKYQ